MVRKRDAGSAAYETRVPKLPEAVSVADLGEACPPIDRAAFDEEPSGSPRWFEDYRAGERVNPARGVTVEEAEHQTGTQLYQNTAKVHFKQFSAGRGRFERRLIYGGHVLSLARVLSFSGLAEAFHISAINGGRHVAPLLPGDTVVAWSETIEGAALPGRDDVGALRVCPVATKNRPCADFPGARGRGYEPHVVLELDYWALAPRRP